MGEFGLLNSDGGLLVGRLRGNSARRLAVAGGRLLMTAAALISAASLVGFLGRWWWAFELASHFASSHPGCEFITGKLETPWVRTICRSWSTFRWTSAAAVSLCNDYQANGK